MRSLTSSVLVSVFAFSASAQTLPNPGALDITRYDDGSAETIWKVQNPNGSSDYFNVAMGGDAKGCVVGLLCNTSGFTGAIQGRIGLYQDNAAMGGCSPDLSLPITTTSMFPTPGPLDCSDTIYDVPDVTVPRGLQTHVVVTMVPGDSALWLCADTDSPVSGRSCFSLDAYSTPAIPHSANYLMGTAAQPCVDAKLWVNGGRSATIKEQEEICILFRGETTFQPFMVFFSSGGVPIGPAVPIVLLTGIVSPVDDSGKTATICNVWPCDAFVGTIGLMAFYKSAAGPWQFTEEATVTVNPDPACGASCSTWGQRDDGILDSTLYKVSNPASPSDWFNVHQGTAPSNVTSVTGVEIASWDFCGTGPSWSRVGMYDSNLVLDPTGGTPDVSASGTIAEVLNPTMPAGASDWAYPATFYNTGSAAPGSKDVHIAMNWRGGDTCIWVAADTDGTDDTSACSTIPSSTSYFSLDGYATPALPHTTANYMQKIIWN